MNKLDLGQIIAIDHSRQNEYRYTSISPQDVFVQDVTID